MTFRADEAKSDGYEKVRNYLVFRNIDIAERARSMEALEKIVNDFGPVIDNYPSWHPLVSNYRNDDWPPTRPNAECGYKGLDHTICFANAFVTCPYHNGQKVIDAVNKLRSHPEASISAKILDVQLYHATATPVLVSCHWNQELPFDRMIPKKLAVSLMVKREMLSWELTQYAETWETMRPYFLGCPHGGRSSLFVNQETGQAMKNIWNALINSGMFGPIKV